MGRNLGGLSTTMIEKTELVSVVIPCYNSGETLGKTIESVGAQTWPNVEIIIVDDGSTDQKTLHLMKSFLGVKLIRQANRGLPAARNAGFHAASGKYILPLDADDWIDPETIVTLLGALNASTAASFAFCDAQLEGEASGRLQKHYNFFEQLFLNQLPYCLLMPKALWEKVGGYDESMRQGYEDWEFNIRLGSLGYHGVRSPQPLFHYRVSSSGMLISKSNRLHGFLWAEIQNRHRLFYKPFRLYQLWGQWKNRPSTRPLSVYFVWLALYRILPASIFCKLFSRLRANVHGQRKNAK